MEKFALEISDAPSIRFTGECIAKASSSSNSASSHYSGSVGHWTELALYKTEGGKYICHRAKRTQWQGERDMCTGKVCQTIAEVTAFFGYGWLAKDIYYDADISDAVDVE